jgi:hypothetical protein
MKLSINRDTRLRDIQTVFTAEFNYLRLEFFRNPVLPFQPSPKKDMRSADEMALSSNSKNLMAGIDINGQLKVSELEELFAREAGLYVQVFRRSGNVWIETTFTDDWSLEQQNKEGELLSTPFTGRSIDVNR